MESIPLYEGLTLSAMPSLIRAVDELHIVSISLSLMETSFPDILDVLSCSDETVQFVAQYLDIDMTTRNTSMTREQYLIAIRTWCDFHEIHEQGAAIPILIEMLQYLTAVLSLQYSLHQKHMRISQSLREAEGGNL